MTIEQIKNNYIQRAQSMRAQVAQTQKQIFRTGTAKLALFTVAIAGTIYTWDMGWPTIAGVLATTLIPFTILAKLQDRLFRKKEYEETWALINEQEIAAFNGNDSNFNNGEEFVDSTHAYTYDLDIFGTKSLFQHLNRTCTWFGKYELSEWLNKHERAKKPIEERQHAIKELTPDIDFRQELRTLGLLSKGTQTDHEQISRWIEQSNLFYGKKLYHTAIIVIPLLNAILLLLGVLQVVSFNAFGTAFIVFFLANLSLQKRITLLQDSFDKHLKILGTYARLMSLIEKKTWQASMLQNIQKDLDLASESVKYLSQLLDELNQRSNFFISTILNGLFFWEVKKIMNIEKWKTKHAHNLPKWLEAVGKTDTLCSLATLAYNNPDYSYPKITDKPFTLTAQEMGHPLMPRSQCIKNDISITRKPFFIIITGANMAGKSTYLRTIGCNYLLACIGAPVCCKSMCITPSQLITSLRTTDSLSENESYFFAELKQLKLIIDRLKQGEELFIILDEILKGTNSVDKQKGSLALIKQFIELKANGIIATHDLALGTLVDNFPENICNYRFEADINGDELSFSYKLKEGVAQNMNACFLMNKMGIVMTD